MCSCTRLHWLVCQLTFAAYYAYRTENPRTNSVSIRMPMDLWEKCDWAAAEVGLDRAAFVRNTLRPSRAKRTAACKRQSA